MIVSALLAYFRQPCPHWWRARHRHFDDGSRWCEPCCEADEASSSWFDPDRHDGSLP